MPYLFAKAHEAPGACPIVQTVGFLTLLTTPCWAAPKAHAAAWMGDEQGRTKAMRSRRDRLDAGPQPRRISPLDGRLALRAHGRLIAPQGRLTALHDRRATTDRAAGMTTAPSPPPENLANKTIVAPRPGDPWIWDLQAAALAVPGLHSRAVPTLDAKVYLVDLFASSAAQIATYRAANKTVICQFDAGAWEASAPDSAAFDPRCWCGPRSIERDRCSEPQHRQVDDGHYWFDIRDGSACRTNLRTLLAGRLLTASRKGCDGVEPDHVDAFSHRGGGWDVDLRDQFEFNLFLAESAHALRLSILLRNAPALLQPWQNATMYRDRIVEAFDGCLDESCHAENTCAIYAPFIAAGKVVFNVEYPGDAALDEFCDTPGIKTLQYASTEIALENLLAAC